MDTLWAGGGRHKPGYETDGSGIFYGCRRDRGGMGFVGTDYNGQA